MASDSQRSFADLSHLVLPIASVIVLAIVSGTATDVLLRCSSSELCQKWEQLAHISAANVGISEFNARAAWGTVVVVSIVASVYALSSAIPALWSAGKRLGTAAKTALGLAMAIVAVLMIAFFLDESLSRRLATDSSGNLNIYEAFPIGPVVDGIERVGAITIAVIAAIVGEINYRLRGYELQAQSLNRGVIARTDGASAMDPTAARELELVADDVLTAHRSAMHWLWIGSFLLVCAVLHATVLVTWVTTTIAVSDSLTADDIKTIPVLAGGMMGVFLSLTLVLIFAPSILRFRGISRDLARIAKPLPSDQAKWMEEHELQFSFPMIVTTAVAFVAPYIMGGSGQVLLNLLVPGSPG